MAFWHRITKREITITNNKKSKLENKQIRIWNIPEKKLKRRLINLEGGGGEGGRGGASMYNN